MKAGHDQTQIAKLLDRQKSTISQELFRNCGLKGYRPRQACELTAKRSEQKRRTILRGRLPTEEVGEEFQSISE